MEAEQYATKKVAISLPHDQLKALAMQLPKPEGAAMYEGGSYLIYNKWMWVDCGEYAPCLEARVGDEWIIEAMDKVAQMAERLTAAWEGGLDDDEMATLIDLNNRVGRHLRGAKRKQLMAGHEG